MAKIARRQNQVLFSNLLQVLGLSHLVILDHLCLLGLKIQEQEVASILLLHLSVQEVTQGDGIPLQEEVANHAQCPVLQA